MGLPVVLATVGGRSVLAQVEPTASGCASLHPSGWIARNFGGDETPCGDIGQQEQFLDEPAPEPLFEDPFADPAPEDDTSIEGGNQGGGKGWGKGGKPK